ncbi:DEAD-domain-containing protein [Auricularia subglabra TFB-10046 SS5]|nr:DEAD-domain-containing protein [Auricularia subglabra TFB-10046 SS5]
MLALTNRISRLSTIAPFRGIFAPSGSTGLLAPIMSSALPPPPPREPQSGAQRRGRSRAGRGRGRGGGAPSNGLVMAATDRAQESGLARAQNFSTTSGLAQGYQSTRRFQETDLHQHLKKVIPWEFMSEIQAKTVDIGLEGKDILGQAKTGTGKTVAFLLPIVQKILEKPPPHGSIAALILSPTRELAFQIAKECTPLLRSTHLNVRTVVGGTNVNTDLKNLAAGCDILVGTPGRVKDHLQNMKLGDRLKNLQAFVLDEADRLLDMGFSPDIRTIISFLPDRAVVPRQSMLFSATMPENVVKIKNMVLLPDHAHVSTIDPEEANAHLHVEQHYIAAPLDAHFPLLLHFIRDDIRKHGAKSKIMAFYPTARGAEIASDLLKGLDHAAAFGAQLKVFEQHSRLSQSARTKSADGFKVAEGGIMATSDVSGRGMDFPNVTLVLQMGPPASGEDYVHRLGRTARAGASGYGILVLAPFDQGFLRFKGMDKMPLKPLPDQEKALAAARELRPAVDAALDSAVDEATKAKAYSAMLGLYASGNRFSGLKSPQVVEMANGYARDVLLWPGEKPPPVKKSTAGKMGLRGVPGLNLVHELPLLEGQQPRQPRGPGKTRIRA